MGRLESYPIAKYLERIRWLVDREFELYSDRIRVHGYVRGVRFDSVVLMTDLAGSPNRV